MALDDATTPKLITRLYVSAPSDSNPYTFLPG